MMAGRVKEVNKVSMAFHSVCEEGGAPSLPLDTPLVLGQLMPGFRVFVTPELQAGSSLSKPIRGARGKKKSLGTRCVSIAVFFAKQNQMFDNFRQTTIGICRCFHSLV